MIQTPRASFSKDGKDKRARGGVLGKRSFTLSDNFYKFPVAWFRRKRKRDTYKLTRSIFPHYTATWFRILSDVTEPSIYVTRHNICEIATLPVYAKRIRQTFQCIVQGEDPERWTSRTVYKISNESKFYTRVSQSSRRKEGKEGGSFTIDKIKITAILLIASFLFFSFFRTRYERVTTLLAFLFAFLTSLK